MKKELLPMLISYLIIICMSIGGCDKNDESKATGLIIGSYCNGFASLIVQVDNKYPIGGTLDYTVEGIGFSLPKKGVYKNLIQVQFNGYREGDNISFSYRKFDTNNSDDSKLFICGNGLIHGGGRHPDLPVFIITDYTILK
jgi:hypothetical protein